MPDIKFVLGKDNLNPMVDTQTMGTCGSITSYIHIIGSTLETHLHYWRGRNGVERPWHRLEMASVAITGCLCSLWLQRIQVSPIPWSHIGAMFLKRDVYNPVCDRKTYQNGKVSVVLTLDSRASTFWLFSNQGKKKKTLAAVSTVLTAANHLI